MKSNKKLDVSALILSIYATLVWVSYIYLNAISYGFMPIVLAIAIFVGNYYLMKLIGQKLRAVDFIGNELTKKQKLLVFFISAAVVFGVMMIWYIAYYPGAFDSDCWNSFRQAIDNDYNDWHPTWFTLVFYKFPLTVFGKLQAIIILQNVYYALILGYMALTICEFSNLKAAVFSIIYLIINPYNCYIMLHGWKDVAFCITALLCTIIAIRLIKKEDQTGKLWKMILYGILLASATMFRHNAILYTAPLILVLLFHIKRKTWIQIVAVTIAFFVLVKGPIYSALDVEKPDRRTEETTGIPLTIIGNVAKETPEKMDEELAEFVYSIATPEQWANYDLTYGYCSLKWSGINAKPIDDQGFFGMVRLMFKAFACSPRASLDALIATTDLVYGFESGLKGYFYAILDDNQYGFVSMNNVWLEEQVYGYGQFFNNSILRYLRTIGVTLFAILVVYLSRMKFTSWDSWKKAFIIIPLFCHDFGTMMLLSGPDARFFFITFLAAPILIVYGLLKEEK